MPPIADLHSQRLYGGAWANVALGVAAIATAFLAQTEPAGFWGNLVAGALVVVLALANVWAASRGAAWRAAWPASINALLGAVLIALPWLLDGDPFYFWANLVVGALLALVAGHNAWVAARADVPERRGRTNV